jgi:hypothetical protein
MTSSRSCVPDDADVAIEPSIPLLVVETYLSPYASLFLAVLACALLVGGAVAYLASPLVNALSAVPGPGLVGALIAGLVIPTPILLRLVTRWEATRYGRVEFYDEGIVFLKCVTRHERTEVEWHDLAGFRDAAPDHVRLVRREKGGRTPEFVLSVPTPNDKTRTAVLQLLDRRGLSRVE